MDQQQLRDAIDVVRDLPCVDKTEIDSKRIVVVAAESLLAGVPCSVGVIGPYKRVDVSGIEDGSFDLEPLQRLRAVIVREPFE